jgi:murein L,D-transpeptidase YcbB/YkuD
MYGRSFVSVIVAGGLGLVFAELVPVAVAAENVATAGQPAAAPGAAKPQPNPTSPSSAAAAPSPSAPDASAPDAATPPSQSTAASPMPAADPVIASIRSKLGDASLRKGADVKDLAALEAFYAERSDPPVWITGMGFSAKAQAAINEFGKADDWGLTASAFELPPAGDLPDNADDQAIAEIKLQLAILKYARFARGGRVDPSSLSVLIDQAPPLLDPKIVLTKIAASPTPAYLQSLHPKHEQFKLKTRAGMHRRSRISSTRAMTAP